eukprot:CAMPEP_0201710276 /NCGR_PEP_ID=MMETSP0578-20130828/58549_1 /ASSEMBLY_ACC=CAM_ASM_000663 /TAXON_ID=267565 /ORGANISM="Skeletonema grethea, Strain CCMP 1804" /LENGTH=455 /DNA_ID=CAMNT_0048199303 /DNA_START=52 /DNA_END=1417 /DNA_ORIENTATION=+
MTESPVLFYSSIILFAVISWAMYKYVLTATNTTAAAAAGPQSRPPASSTPATNNGGATTASTSRNDLATAAAAAANNNNASNRQNNNSATNSEKDESSTFANFHQPKRHPPHLYNPSSSKQHNVSTLDNGGIIPFKLTFASGYETRLSKKSLVSFAPDNTNNGNGEDLIIINRKQRARLFAKLFSIADRPPNRGSNVVVIITHDGGDCGAAKCHKLQKSLMLLGTYYNLFLLVDHKQQQQQQEEVDRDVVKRFRNDLLNVTSESTAKNDYSKDNLTAQILPPHRIIFTSTPEGKVAFVRQLHEAKLVLLGSAKCHKLQKSLMLLGTYYNLFLLVDHKQQQQQQEEVDRDVVKRFRNDLLNIATTESTAKNDNNKDKLTAQISPPHRIIFTSTPEGKVAFVRQLHEAKLVLLGSKEDKVKVELERFGFRVVSYLDETVDGDDVSALGQFFFHDDRS